MICAGGTGGHLVPAMQLAHQLRDSAKCAEVFFAGYNLQNTPFFRRDHFSFYEITSSPLRRNLCAFCWKISRGILQALKVLKTKKPDIIVSFGSYHTFPLMIAAKIKKVPYILFEANTHLGRVHKIVAGRATKIFAQFPLENYAHYQMLPFLPWKEMEKKRTKQQAKQELGLKEDVFTFLVFGGSQGAAFINDFFPQVAFLLQQEMDFQVIHITGGSQEKVSAAYSNLHISCFVTNYCEDMPLLYCAADMAICRGGAATIGELITFHLPALIIPYPYASEQHQEKNAHYFSKVLQGGDYLLQRNLTPGILAEKIQAMRSQLQQFSLQLKHHFVQRNVEPLKNYLLGKEN